MKLSEKKAQAAQIIAIILAKAFNYPDRDFTKELINGVTSEQLAACIGILNLKGLDKPLTDIQDYFKNNKNLKKCQLDLEKEYTWLFFASKPRAVYIFESVYTEGKLLRDSTFNVARMYYDAGLNVVETMKLPPDHIAVELEFLAYLLFNEAKSLNEKHKDKLELAMRMRKELLKNHLGPFTKSFSERLKEKARLPFYGAIAHILEKFIPSIS